jgi:hypothetical protein
VIHYSKKDWWLVALVLAAIVTPMVLGLFFVFWAGDNPSGEPARSLLIIGAVIGVTMLLLTYPLYYRVTESELIVRCGVLMRRHISLATIEEVSPTGDPSSGPAWSMDRLKVNYQNKGEQTFVIISPEDKISFMQELSSSDAALKLRGDRLLRE